MMMTPVLEHMRVRMEKVRDVQTEIGATLDRFYIAGEVSAADILAVLGSESELWLTRSKKDSSETTDADTA